MESKPIRMCIVCRKREKQQELIRVQKRDGNLIWYSGKGRSFYLCYKCLEKQHIAKIVAKREKLNLESVEELIKELVSNVKN
jgi:predicted RNA-binding protein YlxR (DUF448 family)